MTQANSYASVLSPALYSPWISKLFRKKKFIAICKKIIHVYRCFDTELALNNSVYKQQHCIVKTIYRGADNNSLCPFEFCHAWLQKKTAVIFLQAVN